MSNNNRELKATYSKVSGKNPKQKGVMRVAQKYQEIYFEKFGLHVKEYKSLVVIIMVYKTPHSLC